MMYFIYVHRVSVSTPYFDSLIVDRRMPMNDPGLSDRHRTTSAGVPVSYCFPCVVVILVSRHTMCMCLSVHFGTVYVGMTVYVRFSAFPSEHKFLSDVLKQYSIH